MSRRWPRAVLAALAVVAVLFLVVQAFVAANNATGGP